MSRKALLYNIKGHNTEFDQKYFEKMWLWKKLFILKFAKAALISAWISRNCSSLLLDGYSSQLFAPRRSSGWYVQKKIAGPLFYSIK